MSGRPLCSAAAQRIARETLSEMHGVIHVGMSEKEIADEVCARMRSRGSGPWWYHGVGALVLLGNRTTLSVSAREYAPDPENRVSANDVITVDCSPTLAGYWGDYARTFFMEDGILAPEDSPVLPENRRAMEAELHLHEYLLNNLDPDMAYGEAFEILNGVIEGMGWVNLDFHGNLGHSVERNERDRVWLEKGNRLTFREVGKPFTLEPHIRRMEGGHGFKWEDIYYIQGDRFVRL